MSGCTVWWSPGGAGQGKPWAVRHQAEYYLCERWQASCVVVSQHNDEGFAHLPGGPRGVVELVDFVGLRMVGWEKVVAERIAPVVPPVVVEPVTEPTLVPPAEPPLATVHAVPFKAPPKPHKTTQSKPPPKPKPKHR